MDISSVTNSSAQALQALKRSDDTQNPAAVKKDKASEVTPQPTPEAAPKPVINSQGQTTGQILNVSA